MVFFASESWSADVPDCGSTLDVQIEGKPMSFCLNSKPKAWVSKACLDGKKTCGALKILGRSRKKFVSLDGKLKGGRNPGSVLCRELGGKLHYGRLDSESEIIFCEASDATFINSAALAESFYRK